MRYRDRSWVSVLAAGAALLALPYFGLADPYGQAGPSPPPITVDQNGKPLPAPSPTSDLPPNGRVELPSATLTDARGHVRASDSATGTTMPMTVEEMKAHGYLGIPRGEATPDTHSTPVAQSADATADFDRDSLEEGPTELPVDLGPSQPENTTGP